MRIDTLDPIIVVVIDWSDEIMSPFNDQLILKGSSPLLTRQVSCAISPSLTASSPKEKLFIWGGSVKKNIAIATS
jgi:hypothetical protein